MKTKPGCVLLLLAFVASGLSAQTTFMSNMNTTPNDAVFVFDHQWLARQFTTGANAGGYALSHVDLALDFGSDPTFVVSLWSNGMSSQLGTFTHAGGTRFDWLSGASLDASTTYWLILSSGQASNASTNHAWRRSLDDTFALSGGWTTGASASSSDQGNIWFGWPNHYQFAVTATELTAIPEPSTYAALAGLAALMGAIVVRRRRA